MAKILKSERALQSVSSLTLVSPAAPRPSEQLNAADLLRAELAARDADVLALRSEIERTRKDAHDAGLKEGRVQGRQEADQATTTLKASVTAAGKAVTAQIQELEPIAAAIAANALERVIGPLANQSELVLQIVKKQVSALQAEARLEIDVATQDFPSAAALDALKAAFKGHNLDFNASPALASGDCRIKLRLGALDVGSPQQWTALTGALARMARLGPK